MRAEEFYEVVIIGGGLVGASLAVALASSGLSVAVVEAVAVDSHDRDDAGADREQPSFDERTIALTYNAREIYSGMGVWAEIAARHAQPIREIHISDRGRFGMTHLRHDDVGTEALGYVVPSRILGEVLHRRIAKSEGVAKFCPATVEGLDAGDGARRHSNLSVSQNGKTRTLKARLVVVADGGRSGFANQTGFEARHSEYSQRAILSVIETDRDHHGRAFERFTGEGPMALLPHSAGANAWRYALVWTTDARQVAARMALSDAAFTAAVQRAFGDRAGNLARPTPRKCYALQRSRVAHPVGRRTVIIGNAAHTVHPVAGQGFNLGLRDVAVLAEILHRAHRRQRDIGDAKVLDEYAARRRRETRMVSGFTDGLIRVFGSRRQSVALARNLALVGIELFPPAKRFLLRRTMGLADTQPGDPAHNRRPRIRARR